MEPIIVALIGVVGSILVILVEKGRKENTRDHGIVAIKLGEVKSTLADIDGEVSRKLSEVKIALENIDQDVEHIELKLDGHLRDHSFGGFGTTDEYLSPELLKKVRAKKSKKKHVSKKR